MNVIDRHEQFLEKSLLSYLQVPVSEEDKRQLFLDPSFLFPGNFDRRLSTIAPVMAARHECTYIYIYIHVEIGTKCDSPGEQGRGHRGAWGLDILYPSAVFRERISESKVCRQSIRQRGGAASSARTRHDAFERPSLLIRAPLYPNTALRAFMERWNKSGFARDPRMIIGRARSGENSPTGQGSFTAN